MPTVAEMNKERGGGGPPMLHGSDLKRAEVSVKIKVKELREAPKNFGSPAIIDLEESVCDREAFAVNVTNLNTLAGLCGLPDDGSADFSSIASRCKGKTFTLHKIMVNNPKEKKMVYSLFFEPKTK